jgi:hypothetical protein
MLITSELEDRLHAFSTACLPTLQVQWPTSSFGLALDVFLQSQLAWAHSKLQSLDWPVVLLSIYLAANQIQ